MSGSLFEHTQIASYFIWETTGCTQALDLWYCAEDIACFMEQMGILCHERVDAVIRFGVNDQVYIHFLRHIAYRIYVYTGRADPNPNWFSAEKLLHNGEWLSALINMASIYREGKSNQSFINDVKSENVRAYYGEHN